MVFSYRPKDWWTGLFTSTAEFLIDWGDGTGHFSIPDVHTNTTPQTNTLTSAPPPRIHPPTHTYPATQAHTHKQTHTILSYTYSHTPYLKQIHTTPLPPTHVRTKSQTSCHRVRNHTQTPTIYHANTHTLSLYSPNKR